MPQYVRGSIWRLLAWPVGALVVSGGGWYLLLAELEGQRRGVLEDAFHEAAALADGYAEQTVRSIDTIEQAARIVIYKWENSDGKVHLGYADEQGLFLHPMRLQVAVINERGNVVTSTAPTALPADAISDLLAHVRGGLPVNFHSTQVQTDASNPVRHRLLFAWPLTDRDGKFSAAATVVADPAYFTAGHGRFLYKNNGLLAIVGDDGRTLAVRSESRSASISEPTFLHAPRLMVPSGTELVSGAEWFADKRDRIVSWRHIDGRGVSVLVGFDYATVLAPFHELHTAWIGNGAAATIVLALFTLLGMTNSVRLIRKDHELDLMHTTYRTATEGSNEGFYMLRPIRDENGTIDDFEVIDCNRRGAELVGRDRRNVVGRRLSVLYGGGAFDERLKILRRAMETGYAEEVVQRPNAQFPAKWVHLKLVRYGGNLAVTARDITAERVHAQELLRRSNEDPLTRLPNRYWVEGYLPKAIERAGKTNSLFALLFVDLDGFKGINDTWGHAAGDELLCMAAHRLKDAVRPHDCVTRFGGDEFVIVLEDIADPYRAAQVSERILAAFRQSFRLSYGEYIIGTSIGISIFPFDGREARTLLQNADIAMYSVKTGGKGAYRFFDEKFHGELKARLERLRELQHALAHDQFVMHYEPRVRISDGAISSFEALVRWAHPTRGLISPVEFIPLVEESGLILQLGELVIDKVCAQLALWGQRGEEMVPVSVNVSPRQFNETDVARTLTRALERHGVPPGLIEVELTESSVMNETADTVTALQAIQRAGIKVLLDDFGTGYSSLSQLYRLKFDGLKIDRAFVLQLGKAEGGTVIVKAIITMARALGMNVVAEGVETVEQVDMLRKLGCDEIQGYLISKARPPTATQPIARNFVVME
jgi:diguanylate cyclase (GGDEF)-like protein